MEKKENINNESISQNTGAVKPFYSITPFTLLDFPDRTACILWFAGCNMKCVYCYNPDIVYGKGKISIDEVLSFLSKRKNLLDGVVLSGGECTSHKNITTIAAEIKKLGFLVKVDTNGSNPKVIKELVENSLVDLIALDFKAPQDKFVKLTQSNHFKSFEETLQYLISIKFPFEVRTTYHSKLLSQKDIQDILNHLNFKGYTNTYYIQNFLNNSKTIVDLPDSRKNDLDVAALRSDLKIELRNT